METQEELKVPVTRKPDGVYLQRRVATGHIDGRPYQIELALGARHLSIFVDNHDEWRIDLAELAFAVRKRVDAIAKEAD